MKKYLLLALVVVLSSCYWVDGISPPGEFVAEYGGKNNLGVEQELWTLTVNGTVVIAGGSEYRVVLDPPISATCGFDDVVMFVKVNGANVEVDRYQLDWEGL